VHAPAGARYNSAEVVGGPAESRYQRGRREAQARQGAASSKAVYRQWPAGGPDA